MFPAGAVLNGTVIQEVICQQGDIIFPFPQGRNFNGNDIEAIIEIFTKGAFFNFRREIFVGRRNNPNINLQDAAAANALAVS